MTLFGPLLNNIENPAVSISSEEVVKVLGGTAATAAGPYVDEKKSLSIAGVWRAVNLIAGTIASLPLHAYKPDGDARSRIDSGRAADLLSDPHPDMTRFEWLELLVGYVLLWGNAYCLLVWDGKMRPRLLPLHPSMVMPSRDESGRKRYKIEGVDGYLYDASLRSPGVRGMLHVPGFGYDGTKGISAIATARQSLGLALAAEEFGARLFSSGSMSTGVLFSFLGGATFFFGPIIGAVLLVMSSVLLSEITPAWQIYLGFVFLFMVMYAPGGVASLIMMNLRVAAFGKLGRLWTSYLALGGAGAVLLAALSLVVEIVYHLQLDSSGDGSVKFFGVMLNVSSVDVWVGIALVVATALGLFEFVRRSFLHEWGEAQTEIEKEIKRREAAL